MVRIRIVFLALLVLSPILGGCLGRDVATPGALDATPRPPTMTWPKPLVLGDAASFAFQADEDAPRLVQQMVPLSGVARQHTYTYPTQLLTTYAPPVAAAADGSIFTMSLDAVQRSTDGGKTWTTVHVFQSPEAVGLDRWETTDNDLWIDPQTNRVFAGYMNTDGCQVIYTSDDQGTTWKASTLQNHPQSCADDRDIDQKATWLRLSAEQKIFTAAHAGPVPSNLRPYPTSFYWCENVFTMGPKCSVSWDGGETFPVESLIGKPDERCKAEHFGRGAARADGAVVVPLGAATGSPALDYIWIPFVGKVSEPCEGGPVQVSVTQDGGLTWTVKTYPRGDARMFSDVPSIAITRDGVAYLAYADQNQTVRLLRSRDLFDTWEGPFNVSHPGHTLATHPSIATGDDGRVSVAYLASFTPQEPQARPRNASVDTVWHIFTATSFDAAAVSPSWYVRQVNPDEDPLQVGCIWNPPWAWDWDGKQCFNMGLFSSAATTPEGRIVVARLDGCTPRNGCSFDAEGGFAHRDRQVTVAVQDSGHGLVAAKGLLPSLGLVVPGPGKRDGQLFHDE